MSENKSRFSNFIDYFIDVTSFDAALRNALEALNKKIEQPEKVSYYLRSHPGGYLREIYKRRISIAESYIKIAHALESSAYEERLDALETLVQLSFHSKNIAMPLNTARVQIALMKEAIKRKGNRRRQLEILSDFTIASFGQGPVIRKMLRELNLVEVPEEGRSLKDLDLGWDNHVHDSMSEGRKTPCQVLLDAFVKGISSVTLVYYDITEPQIIKESLVAGRILGIDVRIGIEFSVGKSKQRLHYKYLPGHFATPDEFFKFFKDNSNLLDVFIDGLKKNAENRKVVIDTIMKHFNDTHIVRLNQGYEDMAHLCMKPVTLSDLKKHVSSGQYSRIHLGELIYSQLLETSYKRVLYLRTQYQVAKNKKKIGLISQWELDQLTSQYETVRRYYEDMSPERLNEKFLEDRAQVDYDSAFLEEDNIFPQLIACGGEIKFIHPLQIGMKNAVTTLIKNHKFITRVETFNNTDSSRRNPNELILFNKFIEIINNKSYAELQRFLTEWKISDLPEETILAALNHYHEIPVVPKCGSDATGRDPKIPGMGFIKSKSIPPGGRKWFVATHAIIPAPISSLILGEGRPLPDAQWNKLSEDERHIVLMGSKKQRRKNLIGDESEEEAISLPRYMKYLNPWIKNFFRVAIGILPAYYTFYTQFSSKTMGLAFAGLWFAITFLRNIIVDLVAAHGLDVKEWSWNDINFENTFQSLFWTGWSVPILNEVKLGFDALWLMGGFVSTVLKDIVKFFFICVANGTYIYSHNTLRNFDDKVKKANFFRTVMAWPFATLTAPLGDFFNIPSIVQAKIWSDTIAAFIEGTGKFTQRIVIRKRDLTEIMPNLASADRFQRMAAALDVLYIWARQQRGQTCLEQILLNRTAFYKIFKRPESSSERAKKHEYSVNAFNNIFNFFHDEGCSIALCNFVIEYYSGKEAEMLTNLIGGHFEHFKEWLYSIKMTLDRQDKLLNEEGRLDE